MISEWRHLYRRFRDFVAMLRLSPAEANRAASVAISVAMSLRRRFHPEGGAISDYLPIGSHGKGTAIRPSDTIDLVYELPPEWGQPTVVDDVAALLGGRDAGVEPDKGWLTVRPEGGGIAVRVIPAFADPSGRGYLTVDPETPPYAETRWRRIHPLAEAEALRLADLASSDKATHLVLMVKAWRRNRRVPIGSYAVERLVVEFVAVWTAQRRRILFYDWMIRDFFFWMRWQHGRIVQVPGTPEGLPLGSDWLADAEDAYLLALQACLLAHENRNDEAVILWSRLFGRAFIDGTMECPALPETPAVAGEGKISSVA